MKSLLIIVLLMAALGAGGWWLVVKRPAEQRAFREAQAAAAAAAQRAEKTALFGEEAAHPDVQWRDTGLGYRVLEPGQGPKPFPGARISMRYVGRLKDGTVFDRATEPAEFRIGGMVPGMSAAAQMLSPGGKGIFFIPPKLGYGGMKVAGLPANSPLIFEIELVAINP